MLVAGVPVRPEHLPGGINKHQQRFQLVARQGHRPVEGAETSHVTHGESQTDGPTHSRAFGKSLDVRLPRGGEAEKADIPAAVFFLELNQPGRGRFTEWSPQRGEIENRQTPAQAFLACF